MNSTIVPRTSFYPDNQNLIYFENALSKIPAFDMGYAHTKASKRLEFQWASKDPDGNTVASQCFVEPIPVETDHNPSEQRLPGDIEHDVFLFVVDRYARGLFNGPENWIAFTYKDVADFLGYGKNSNNGKFRSEVRTAIRTLASAKIVAKNAWHEKGGFVVNKEVIVRYFDDYELEERVATNANKGRGKKAILRVQIGKQFQKNLNSKYISVITSEIFPKLKGTSALRRLAHIIASRADEQGNPEILHIYCDELRISMSFDTDAPNFRFKEKMNRLFKGIVSAGLIKKDPEWIKDDYNREICVLYPISQIDTLSNSENSQSQKLDLITFEKALKKYRNISFQSTQIQKPQLQKIYNEYSEKELIEGLRIPRILLVLESLLVQHVGNEEKMNKKGGVIPLLRWALKNFDKFEFVEDPFVSCILQYKKDQQRIELSKAEDVKNKEESSLRKEAQQIFSKYSDKIRVNYSKETKEFLEKYSQTVFGRDRIKQYELNPAILDPQIFELFFNDFKNGKLWIANLNNEKLNDQNGQIDLI